MTFNVELEEDCWEAIMSERLPQVLDDAFKSARLMSMADLCDGLDVDLIFKRLLTASPRGSKVVETFTGKPIHGVAQYPIEKWEKSGRPYMTVASRINLCMIVGEGKPQLADIVAVADMFEDTTQGDHKCSFRKL